MPLPLLYEHPLSPFAQKNKIALREKGTWWALSEQMHHSLGVGA